jgi:cytochrome c
VLGMEAMGGNRKRVPKRRFRTGGTIIFAGLLVLLVAELTGCADPDSAILACHDLAGTVKKVGPSLQGVYGRRSGLAPGYQGSPELIGAAIVWDDRTLRAFLSNPSGFIPGNRMVSPGIRNGNALTDFLFYLRHVSPMGARDTQ